MFSAGRKGQEVASISARVIFTSMNYVLPANICVINSMAYFLKLIQMSIKKFIENEKKNKSVLAYVNVYI